jgi:hypothetical protein
MIDIARKILVHDRLHFVIRDSGPRIMRNEENLCADK